MPDEYRAYWACEKFGWTVEEYENAPAVFIDNAMAFAASEAEASEMR